MNKELSAEQIEKWIDLVERFIPKDIALDDRKQIAMYELYHSMKLAKQYAASKGSAEEVISNLKEELKRAQEVATYPFFQKKGGWYFIYRDFEGLTQHSPTYPDYDAMFQHYAEMVSCNESEVKKLKAESPQPTQPASEPAPTDERLSVAQLIAEERQRQVDKEGYNSDHDAHHVFDELAYAAITYTLPNPVVNLDIDESVGVNVSFSRDAIWPFHRSEFNPSGNRIKDLVKAGALIAAEIDRLQNL